MRCRIGSGRVEPSHRSDRLESIPGRSDVRRMGKAYGSTRRLVRVGSTTTSARYHGGFNEVDVPLSVMFRRHAHDLPTAPIERDAMAVSLWDTSTRRTIGKKSSIGGMARKGPAVARIRFRPRKRRVFGTFGGEGIAKGSIL